MRRHPLEAATEFVIKSVDGGSHNSLSTEKMWITDFSKLRFQMLVGENGEREFL